MIMLSLEPLNRVTHGIPLQRIQPELRGLDCERDVLNVAPPLARGHHNFPPLDLGLI